MLRKCGWPGVGFMCVTVILIGAGAVVPAQAGPGCGPAYTVLAGDSLGRVAKRCDVAVSDLRSANPGLSRKAHLRIGQVLKIPGVAQQTRVADGPVMVSGEIVNGRWCAQLRTEDGTVYGVVGRNVSFRSGAVVQVRGVPTSDARCTPGTTLVVTEMSPVSR